MLIVIEESLLIFDRLLNFIYISIVFILDYKNAMYTLNFILSTIFETFWILFDRLDYVVIFIKRSIEESISYIYQNQKDVKGFTNKIDIITEDIDKMLGNCSRELQTFL